MASHTGWGTLLQTRTKVKRVLFWTQRLSKAVIRTSRIHSFKNITVSLCGLCEADSARVDIVHVMNRSCVRLLSNWVFVFQNFRNGFHGCWLGWFKLPALRLNTKSTKIKDPSRFKREEERHHCGGNHGVPRICDKWPMILVISQQRRS